MDGPLLFQQGRPRLEHISSTTSLVAQNWWKNLPGAPRFDGKSDDEINPLIVKSTLCPHHSPSKVTMKPRFSTEIPTNSHGHRCFPTHGKVTGLACLEQIPTPTAGRQSTGNRPETFAARGTGVFQFRGDFSKQKWCPDSLPVLLIYIYIFFLITNNI